tara:strand:+ start:775 stop:1113 length:339 start_codon:yes stop_codon:yes gene_type:complete
MTLNKNHEKGFTKTECNKTDNDAIDAKAAKTLICPTLEITGVAVLAPIKYPTKYPDIIKPVDSRLKFSATALTPRSEFWYPYDNMIILMPKNKAQEFLTILFINRLLIICDL